MLQKPQRCYNNDVKGNIKLPVKVAEKHGELKFYVLESSETGFFLGLDFLDCEQLDMVFSELALTLDPIDSIRMYHTNLRIIKSIRFFAMNMIPAVCTKKI